MNLTKPELVHDILKQLQDARTSGVPDEGLAEIMYQWFLGRLESHAKRIHAAIDPDGKEIVGRFLSHAIALALVHRNGDDSMSEAIMEDFLKFDPLAIECEIADLTEAS